MLSYVTKAGQQITFKVYEKDPKDKAVNTGWILHRIEASVDGLPAGYLKISYIPKALWDKYFPTVWDWKAEFGGWGRYHGEGEKPNLSLLDTYLMVTRYTSMDRFNDYDYRKIIPTEQEMTQFLKRMEKQYLPAYKEAQAFHVDKPMVDYIHVEDDFRRQGIATALYKFGARWLAKTKGLPLYASGLQQPEAAAAWTNMKRPIKRIPIQTEPHPLYKDRTRTKIDYREEMAKRIASQWLTQ